MQVIAGEIGEGHHTINNSEEKIKHVSGSRNSRFGWEILFYFTVYLFRPLTVIQIEQSKRFPPSSQLLQRQSLRLGVHPSLNIVLK